MIAAPNQAPEAFGRWRIGLLATLVAIGGVLLLDWSLPGTAPLWRLAGAALLVYAVFVGLAWFPAPWLSRRIEAQFEGWIGHGHGGFYLVVAIAHFLLAEFADARAQLAEWVSLDEAVRDSLWRLLMGFSIESVMNLLWASLWPWMAIAEHGLLPTAVFAGAGYGLWWAGRLAFGETRLDQWAEEPSGDRKPPAR